MNRDPRRGSQRKKGRNLGLVIFTDLDGTLLDEKTYSWELASQALENCKAMGIPIVIATSKTRAEVEEVQRALGLTDPFIVENGGAIFFPPKSCWPLPKEATFEGRYWKWELGQPYDKLVKALRKIRNKLGWKIKGFSDMDLSEICRLTDLGEREATLSASRGYDEPFLVMEPNPPDDSLLEEYVKREGLKITKGGRFYHIHGIHDKGTAMEKLLQLLRKQGKEVLSIALGDSPIDFPLLKRADIAVLVRSGRTYPELEREIPGLLITSEKGPQGWQDAILDIVEKYKEETR